MVAHRRARPAGPPTHNPETSATRSGWNVPPVSCELDGFQPYDAISALSEVGPQEDEGNTPAITDARTKAVYDKHVNEVQGAQLNLVNHAWSEKRFVSIFTANQAKYERVASQANVPAVLVAAIHFRESGGNFGTYLHNGEKLGKVTTLVPKGILFDEWEPAAVHALTQFSELRDELGMSSATTNMASMATFAEHYNGLGYHYKGIASPYVYSGTDAYTSGKYVADHVFDPNAVDKQLGVMAMVQLGQDATGQVGQKPTPKDGAANTPAANTPQQNQSPSNDMGAATLRKGNRGPFVSALQRLLVAGGQTLKVDGDFGPRTDAAVRAFQEEHGLTVDGLVGKKTKAILSTC